MVWPFGPSASFHAIVSAKQAHRDRAINAGVAAVQGEGPLTAEDVAIIGKSGKPPVQALSACRSNPLNLDGFRFGDRPIHPER